ncbi:MAG: hypothetical protein WC678_03175 [Parcubacteria group bacterium]|jgi:hypothetical protein
MPNINLATENVPRGSSNSIGKGLLSVIIILILVIVLYGALLFVNSQLSSKTKAVQDEYDLEYQKFLSGNGNEIIDFKNRSDVAEKIIAENKSMAEIMSHIESSMLSSVYLNSLKYDKTSKTISLLCVGDNFQTVAKQILSFKQDNYFSAVIPSRNSIDTKNNNKLNFSIDLVIK